MRASTIQLVVSVALLVGFLTWAYVNHHDCVSRHCPAGMTPTVLYGGRCICSVEPTP